MSSSQDQKIDLCPNLVGSSAVNWNAKEGSQAYEEVEVYERERAIEFIKSAIKRYNINLSDLKLIN